MTLRSVPPGEETGAGEPSHELPASGRSADGTFAPGNVAAVRHGRYSAQLVEPAEARAALAEREAAIVADLGGADRLSALAVGHVATYARLEVVADFMWRNLQTLGPLTKKGRQRAALTAWLAVIDRMHRVASALGLERHAKSTMPSPTDWIEGKV